MIKKDIVIIDSGVCYAHPLLSDLNIEGITVHDTGGKYTISRGAIDEIGHGTAVCSTIFSSLTNKSNYHALMIKIFEKSSSVELEALLFALSYIENEIDCDIIHISSGVLEYSLELHERCKRLIHKGTYIVAAYDNDGAVSYPAAFDEVIGVDTSSECKKRDQWIYVENGIVNILAKGGNHRIAWTSPDYIITQGASFSAGYITSIIAEQLKKGLPKDAVINFLRKEAIKVYNPSAKIVEQNKQPIFNFSPNKAALFPYNKEMHSLINFYGMLPFEIQGIYSSKYLGHIGRECISINNNYRFIIQNIDDLDWKSIDTLILGHVIEISDSTKIDYKSKLLDKCLENNVNVYSFDNRGMESYPSKFEEKGLKFFYPQVRSDDLVKKDGKLYSITAPVLGVFGTSSVQGKFSLQLLLRQLLMERGYTVGQLGTEPTSFLFGMDEIYPFGYASSVTTKEDVSVEMINQLMHKIDCKTPDIILVGSQSGTIPACFFNTKYLNIPQQMFLMGTDPDAVILCVNVQDDPIYIERTIAVIENLVFCKVIAIVISPLVFPNDLSLIRQKKQKATLEQIEAFKQKLKLIRPVFLLGETDEMKDLLEICLEFFTDGGT